MISICLLAYKRPELLMRCIDSIHATADSPFELIVNVDGEENQDQHAASIAYEYFRQGKISKLISIGGLNRGVGRSFQNCLGVAEGDIIVKIDTDLTFKEHWLSRAVHALENNSDVGCISLFNYNHYDPTDKRFTILEDRSDVYLVSDFVSSIYAFRTTDAYRYDDGPLFINKTVPDDGLHQQFGKMAITKEDYVINHGFGEKSVYLTFDEYGKPSKTKTYDTPLLFGN